MIKRIDARKMRARRHRRVRMRLSGTSERPRIAVFRSSEHIYAQIIDDTAGRTLVQASSLDKGIDDVQPAVLATAQPEPAPAAIKPATGGKGGKQPPAKEAKGERKAAAPAVLGKKSRQAQQVGTLLAQRAQAKGIKKVVFDRGGYVYHGRIKALADSARAAGLEF